METRKICHHTYALLGIEMAALAQEQLRVLLLDTKNGVMHIATIYQGTVNASLVRAAEEHRTNIYQIRATLLYSLA